MFINMFTGPASSVVETLEVLGAVQETEQKTSFNNMFRDGWAKDGSFPQEFILDYFFLNQFYGFSILQ